MLDFGNITMPYVMEIVSNLGVKCIIGWRFMLLLGAETEPSLAHGSYATITHSKACIPSISSISTSEMPQIRIMNSEEAPRRLGKLYMSKEECEEAVKGRAERNPSLLRTCSSEMKRLIKEHGEGGKAWESHIMNTSEVEKIERKKKSDGGARSWRRYIP